MKTGPRLINNGEYVEYMEPEIKLEIKKEIRPEIKVKDRAGANDEERGGRISGYKAEM